MKLGWKLHKDFMFSLVLIGLWCSQIIESRSLSNHMIRYQRGKKSLRKLSTREIWAYLLLTIFFQPQKLNEFNLFVFGLSPTRVLAPKQICEWKQRTSRVDVSHSLGIFWNKGHRWRKAATTTCLQSVSRCCARKQTEITWKITRKNLLLFIIIKNTQQIFGWFYFFLLSVLCFHRTNEKKNFWQHSIESRFFYFLLIPLAFQQKKTNFSY